MKPVFLVTLTALLVAGAADAQSPGNPRPGAPPVRESVRKACESDAQALCAGKQERERSLCLLNNLERLSPACRSALGEPTASPQRPPAPQPPK